MTQLDSCEVKSRVLSWHQFTTMLSEDNGINCEEDWYEQTNQWVEEPHESDTEDPFLLDDKTSFLKWGRANDLQESTMSELINEDISSINIARLLSNDDIDELKIPLRQKYAMTQAVHHLNTSPTNGLDDLKNRFNKQKTYSVIERMTEKTNTKLSKSRSERITKVEKMNIWKRWKKPSGSNSNFNELHEGPVQEGDSG